MESFSEVRISYITPIGENTENRKKELKLHYHFDCECRLCEDEEKDNCRSSMLCPKAKSGSDNYYEHCIPMKTAKCIKCGSKISQKIIEDYQRLKLSFNNVDGDLGSLSYGEWRSQRSEARNIFHPYDSTFFEYAQNYTKMLKEGIQTHNLQDQDYFRKLNIAMATHIEKYVGEYDPLRGSVYFQCAMNLSVSKQEETLQLCSIFLNAAMEVMEVTHGIDHPQYELMQQKFNELGNPESDPDADSDSDSETDDSESEMMPGAAIPPTIPPQCVNQ